MSTYRRPKELGTVVHSWNAPGDDSVCVDLMRDGEGRWRFELYRRDVETAEGWFPIGHFSGTLYPQRAEAMAAARRAVPWLNDILD